MPSSSRLPGCRRGERFRWRPRREGRLGDRCPRTNRRVRRKRSQAPRSDPGDREPPGRQPVPRQGLGSNRRCGCSGLRRDAPAPVVRGSTWHSGDTCFRRRRCVLPSPGAALPPPLGRCGGSTATSTAVLAEHQPIPGPRSLLPRDARRKRPSPTWRCDEPSRTRPLRRCAHRRGRHHRHVTAAGIYPSDSSTAPEIRARNASASLAAIGRSGGQMSPTASPSIRGRT